MNYNRGQRTGRPPVSPEARRFIALFKRGWAGIFGIGMIMLSIYFNVVGLGLDATKTNDFGSWAGVIYGCAITAMQLVGSSRGVSITVGVMLVFSYVFGVTTNYLGIAALQANPDSLLAQIVRVTFAVINDFLPEHLVIYAITGQWAGGDVLGRMINFIAKMFGFGEPIKIVYDDDEDDLSSAPSAPASVPQAHGGGNNYGGGRPNSGNTGGAGYPSNGYMQPPRPQSYAPPAAVRPAPPVSIGASGGSFQ
jgi:hypothetical protein